MPKDFEMATFRGKLLKDCTREELFDAIKVLNDMLDQEKEAHRQTMRMWEMIRNNA